MKRLHIFLYAIITIFTLIGCINEEEYTDNPQGNFEALWRIIDEHYCFFNYKNIDWNEIHARYAKQMNNDMTERQLFEVLTNMLSELKDGHVNLYTTFDLGRYWSWRENHPNNFSDTLTRKYLGTDYHIASGMQYRILDDNTGYLRCNSFVNGISSGSLDDILLYLAPCNGLIIDIRNNSGGQLTSAETLASRFTNKEILVGYMQHKTGKGHNDFSSLQEQWLKPSSGLRWQKQTVVLTNRSVYSAANEFVKYMKQCPLVTVVGDKTGGGAGLPFSSELPNGWSVRFSACPMFDKNKKSSEFGIEPHHNVSLTATDFTKGKDTIIEYARTLLLSH